MSEIITIKRFDPGLPLPEYKTPGAAGFDLCAREAVEVPPGACAKVPLNVAIALPEGHWALLAARSSLHKKGLMAANGIGVMDYDYRGDSDEYVCVLYNFTAETAAVAKGERIMQAVVLPYAQLPIVEAASLGQARGGFGTTGTH